MLFLCSQRNEVTEKQAHSMIGHLTLCPIGLTLGRQIVLGNVGNVRPSFHGNAATGAIGTGAVGTVLDVGIGTSTDHNDTAVHAAQERTVSWADVVRGSTLVRTTLGTATKDTNGSKGQQVTKRSRFVSRSFS